MVTVMVSDGDWWHIPSGNSTNGTTDNGKHIYVYVYIYMYIYMYIYIHIYIFILAISIGHV